MKLALLIGTIVVVAGIIVYLVVLRPATSTDIEFVPASVSNQRVAELGLRQASQDNPGILKISEIRFREPEVQADDEYKAIPELEWIVDIHPPKGFTFKKQRFLEVFDYDWGRRYSSTFYAYFPSTGQWSYAVAGGSPEEFDSLQLAVPLAGRFEEKELSVERFEEYLRELSFRLKKFGVDFEVTPRETILDATARAHTLTKFQDSIVSEVVVVLKSDSEFESIDFWNTLVDLGLKWGDGDLFHWENYESGIGDQRFFSVWTSTDPGYFLPEEVENHTCKPKDLIFGFSIPRSADAEKVFEMMVESTEFCQMRLGGKLFNEDGQPLNKERYKLMIKETLAKMRENGFEPGRGHTLRIF